MDDTTYAGTWPCGSCAQRLVVLTLFADHHFRMRQRDLDAAGAGLAEGPMRLRGLYCYMADAASFQECLSGRHWPVLIEGEHIALERAYLAQGEGGRWVLATLAAASSKAATACRSRPWR